MKKLWAWLKKPKSTLFKSLVGLGILFTAIGSIILITTQPLQNNTNETTTELSITSSEQTYLIAKSGIPPVSWEPNKEEKTVGFYTAEAVAANVLTKKIENTEKLYDSITINPDSNIIAVSYPEEETIYVSTLLLAQLEEILPAINASEANVEIIPTLVKNTTTVATRAGLVAGRPVTTTTNSSYNVTVPSAGTIYTPVNNTAKIVDDIGATNPYIQAVSGQKIDTNPQSTNTFMLFLIPFMIIGYVLLAFFLMRYVLGREKRTSRKAEKEAKKKEEASEIPPTRFTDVAGCDEAIEDMYELVEYLKDPHKFAAVGAKPPHGALLVGPPGTGKTLIARAVAGEAGVPFYAAAGSDFVEMYVGVGAKRIRELFSKARKHEEGAIIFIDEIDAVARSRASGNSTASNTEAENTLNALLVEMDGFTQSKVIVLAATNRDDMLDKAILRPGRLERKIHVGLPDRLGREKILAIYTQNRPIADTVDLTLIARRTPGMSGADLAQLVNEACLVAARDGRDLVDDNDFDAAVATVAMGKARTSAIVTEHDRLVTAWHEAGHTVSAMVLPDADPPVSVSIIPRGPAGGVTWMAQGDDLFLTRKRAFARLVVAMSGRAAEEIYLEGEFTSGPHGDLTAATETALAMVTKYGMTDAGLMIKSDGLLSTGSKVTDETIVAVENLLAEALETARETLAAHKDLLESIVEGLLDKDTLVLSDLNSLESNVDKVLPKLPSPPKEYRKEKIVEPVVNVQPVIERVRFETPVKKRRGVRIGRLFIALEKKPRKGKGEVF